MRKTKKQRFRASILAFLLIASMVLGMAPGSAGQVYAKESTSSPSEEEPGLIDKAVDFFQNTGDNIVSFFGAGGEAQPAAAFDETSIVDKETSQGWKTIVKNTTQNIGRIWTDKSVYNGNVTLPGIGDGASIPITKPKESDFMVGLSALSSTSNTSVTTSTPLDIVLVLDVSGSMSNNLGTTYEYTAAYNINKDGRTAYYALDKAEQYVKVKRVTSRFQFDHWELNGVTVEPKTSRDDNDPDHIQFYSRSRKEISRIDALKDAASAFVDATAVQNQGINEANQHRLSVVTFSDRGKVEQGLTACNDNNAQTIKNTIGRLGTSGNTYPGNAMRSAQQALGEARDGAQKVVIFFTDGNPAPEGTDDFNESMANDGVQGALTLKNSETKIFSIGIFEGADPGNTSIGTNNQFNAYMHAMSSNYPKATAWNQLGERSTDKLEYYYAATSSDELSEIFQHISEEINTGTGYPTETDEGSANTSGYVTFHDQLGDYMQVDSFNTLVLEDIRFDEVEKTEADGVITYTYKGSAGENKNVSYIVIKVTPGTGSTGDTVDVKIPASLLPLRHFKVDVSGNKMTVEDKYPLRLFYNVSLKEDAKKALANPNQEMKNYIAKNKEGGNVYFYSNKFTGSKQGPTEEQTLGDTTATFKPATGNSFYYFTENTMLWLDEQMRQPATSYSAEQGYDTYYYEKAYYKLVEGKPEKVTEAVSFRPHPQDEVQDWVGTTTDGQLYIKAGAPRLTRIHDLTSSKKTNVTGTATEVITPNWDDELAQRNIEVSLGNNGRLAVELPGTLEISKTVTSEVDAPEKDFNFKLTLKNAGGEALTGEFDAQKFDAQGVASGDPIKVQNDGTVTLKDGESVKIYGLSNGDTYSIEETQIPKGFTAKENPIEGTIKGNEIVTAKFENTYAATGELDGNTNLKVTKNFTGREGNKWLESDVFTFTLTAADDEATQNAIKEELIKLPDPTEITINSKTEGKQAAFGNITFSTAGTFKFNVTEQESGIAGVTDDAKPVRAIVVNVVDNGNGTLTATVVDESDNLTFTNVYKASSIGLGEDKQFKVTKNLVGREWTDGDAFEFTLTAKDGAPMPAEGGNVVIATNAEKTQKFGEITYDAAGTYEYQITEEVPETPEEGMTYDTHTATVTVKVTEDYATGTLSIKSVTYSDGADATAAQFTNVVGNNTKDVQNAESNSLDNGMVGVGDELTYVINWVNDGVDETGAPAAATVKVTDIIPEGTEYVVDSATKGAVYDKDAHTLTWTIKAKAAQTGSVSFKVVVTDKAGGTEIANTGEITVGKNAPKVTNTVETTVPGKKETTNPDKIEEGTILTYEIKFRNTDGDGAATEVVDNMTPGLEYQLGTATVNDQVSDPEVEGDSATGQTLTWNLEGLAENAEVTIRFNVKVTRDALESVDNSATINGHKSNVVTTPYPSDDKKSVADANGNDQDNGMVGVGNELTYTIDWAAEDAGKVIITDVVPKGTEFVKASKDGKLKDGTVTWTIDNVKKGQKGSVNFTVRVTGTVSGENIKNKANIKVGDRDPKVTNEVETFIPGKGSVVEDGGELQVGSVLTYTISYKNPEAEATTVTISDKIPKGLDYVEGSAGNNASYDADNRTLTWTLENVPAGKKGEVSFKASVNESAVEKVENKATIQIGENNPKYETNTDSKSVPKSGALAISKTIALTEGQGTEIDTEKTFEFTVALTDSKDKVLTKAYTYTITNKKDEKVSSGEVAHNGTISLKHGETATITGLPAGTKFTVTEIAAEGYTPSSEGGVINGSVTAEEKAKADFTNTYSVTGNLNGTDSLKVTKNFTGREGNQWLEGDKFTFTLTAADDKATQDAIKANLIKLPEITEITIDGTMAEKQAAFGNITFNIAGTFKFNVTEQESGIAGVTDDAKPVREIVVNVVDNKDGTLTATIAEKSDNLTFTNTYGAESGENNIAEQISATKKLTGRDMQAGEFDFEVVTRKTPKYTGDFTPVVVATGTNAAAAEGAEGDVTFAGYDANGKMNLVYTTESLNQAVTDGYAIKAVVDGKTVWTVNYTARELTNNLPEGVTSIVEKTAFDFTVVVTDNTDGRLIAEVQYPNGAITFENTYATGGTIVDTDPTDANAFFYKVLEGRDWLETDAFTFTIEPQDGAPAPIDAEGNPVTTVTVTKADLKDGKAPFGFGKIHFTDANMGTASEKTFMYHVKEKDIDAEAMPGVSKDTHTAKFSITLTDDGEGTLSAATPVVTDGIFTNRYESSLDYNAVGGLQISKVLNGRDMQKDQFTFTLTPKATEGSTTAEEAAQKLGFAEVKAYEFKNEAAAMGEATYMNVLSGKEVVFTQADAGNTYTYEIVEVKGQNEAYTYDEAVNIVTITVVDNNNGTLTVTTTVTKNGEVVDTKVVSTGGDPAAPATVPFVNVYNDVPESLGGEGSVAINATKSLTNRPMADREFTFHVTDKNEAQVATGNNDASGKITFTPIEYTTDKLNEDAEKGTATKSYDVEKDAYTYTYQYKVEEDLSNVDEGVTGIVTAFSIQVVVTDDGNGNLTIAVVYPDGKDPLPFENAYGTSAEAAIHVNGQKVLNVESGNNAPDITGKYIFTLSGSDGAPMPEKATANNDAAGNVDFGKITYTMQNVFGDKGVTAEAEGTEEALTEVMPVSDTRTKTFTYTVTESGTVEGVTNDAESVKTFNVTVTDNGDGTIKVDKDYTGFEFGFTNTYHVEPVDFDINDAEAGITVKKELTGRAMNAGEFVFELISDKDKSVREAVNDTDGNVKFETMNFTAPGEYIYTLRERNTKLGGVDYDTTEYQVVVTVTDNGDGTMSAEAKLADEGKDVVFKNQYEAAPTSVMFGASKIYKGADLKDGQFTFVVKDADGNVVSEAKNNKDGMVTFDTIEFNEEGTYTFTISEKNDKQKNVTYDKAVYEVTVTVTDNGEGSLIAEVAYADGKAPVFTNKYTKPAKPAKPEEPKGPTAVKTGDEAPVIPFIILMVATLAIIVTITFIFFRRKRR